MPERNPGVVSMSVEFLEAVLTGKAQATPWSNAPADLKVLSVRSFTADQIRCLVDSEKIPARKRGEPLPELNLVYGNGEVPKKLPPLIARRAPELRKEGSQDG